MSQAGLELNLWEKFTDTLGSISEGVVGFMGKLFGSNNEKLIRAVGYIRGKGSDAHTIVAGSLLAQVNSWEEHMQSLSDEDLKGMTVHFRERLEAGETLDDILPEAYAAVREAGWRFKKMRHFDVQIVGGAILHQGRIAEMVTGEGKTLVATLAAFLNGLTAQGVHVITVNDYLARRDCEWMSPIYNGLGMTASYIQSEMDAPERRRAYDCDITYGTNSEFGFDYLRDNMKPARWGDPNYPPGLHQVQRGLNYAIIDEVDNILIDEARTPLIISGPSSGAPKRYLDADRIARELTRLEKEAQKKLRALGHGVNIPDHPLAASEEELAAAEERERKKVEEEQERRARIEEERKAALLQAYDRSEAEGKALEATFAEEDRKNANTAIQDLPMTRGIQDMAAPAAEGLVETKKSDAPTDIRIQNQAPTGSVKKPASKQGRRKGGANAADATDVVKDDIGQDVDDDKIEQYVASANVDKKEKRLGYYFEVKEKERSCHLTDVGVRKAEELAGVESFYTAGNMEWPHLLDNALKAHHLYHKDKDYVVMQDPESSKMAIIIVDTFTGRLMLGRQWSDGLHQAVEAKHAREHVVIKEETQTLATITLQNYFRLYKKLAGMTGTAMTEASEFWKIYKLEVVNIPTNKPLHRVNYPDAVFLSEKEKWDAVVKEIERIHKLDVVHLKDGNELVGLIKTENETDIVIELKESREKQTIPFDSIDEVDRHGRPMLVGTTSVEKSEKLKRMLDRKGIKCELLNAKPEHAGREADIVAQAGRIGSVTIATNMAGRGTDIILGGNPETLAWARLKNDYATRLEVPDDVWKNTVEEMRVKENMEEEGREVVEMGGLHIVGTERHESRRIDNQLRGRAGRQGDPGSGRFYVSLQDDLMRIFGGEWVANWLQRMGMQEGEAIENSMVTRRIESCQKKVEEHNFDIRKNLLEYDEVMDYQRKRVYGYRQEILNDANCKTRIWAMMLKRIDLALDEYLDPLFGARCFAQLVAERLIGSSSLDPESGEKPQGKDEGEHPFSRPPDFSDLMQQTTITAADFAKCSFQDADRLAREFAIRHRQNLIQELLDENLDDQDDPANWNWQAMADRVKKIWHIDTTPTELKKIGRDKIGGFLLEETDRVVKSADLTDGAEFLERGFGYRTVCAWVYWTFGLDPITDRRYEALDVDRRYKGLYVDPNEYIGKNTRDEMSRDQIRQSIVDRLKKLYSDKEIEFPLILAMSRVTSVARGPDGRPIVGRIDREGLYRWYLDRFGAQAGINEETFRAEALSKLLDMLIDVSRKSFPEMTHEDIDDAIHKVFDGAMRAPEAAAEQLAKWAKSNLALDVNVEDLVTEHKDRRIVEFDHARNLVWNAYDKRYRSEMRQMERSLLLNLLDIAWKNHLLTMDHLRQGIGLVGYAQIDPKTEFKRVGMKEFDAMWDDLAGKVTDLFFKLKDADFFDQSVWAIDKAVHESAPQPTAAPESIQAQQQAGIAGSQTSDKKAEPIRNRSDRVGRNDPCPCGSGKKYKNCHMRRAM